MQPRFTYYARVYYIITCSEVLTCNVSLEYSDCKKRNHESLNIYFNRYFGAMMQTHVLGVKLICGNFDPK